MRGTRHHLRQQEACMHHQDALITADVAAEYLGISRHRLYVLTRQRAIPSVRIGRSIRYAPSALRALVEAGGTAAGAGDNVRPASGA
jgi:excisionase family DNA binding protein